MDWISEACYLTLCQLGSMNRARSLNYYKSQYSLWWFILEWHIPQGAMACKNSILSFEKCAQPEIKRLINLGRPWCLKGVSCCAENIMLKASAYWRTSSKWRYSKHSEDTLNRHLKRIYGWLEFLVALYKCLFYFFSTFNILSENSRYPSVLQIMQHVVSLCICYFMQMFSPEIGCWV